MAGRASFEQITETDFSSLFQALSASPKGRLFLDEYRRRNRSEEAVQLFDSMKRIETTIAGVRDQFQPERLAEELRNIAMTLEIALDGAAADPEGDDIARRFALIGGAHLELARWPGGSPAKTVSACVTAPRMRRLRSNSRPIKAHSSRSLDLAITSPRPSGRRGLHPPASHPRYSRLRAPRQPFFLAPPAGH